MYGSTSYGGTTYGGTKKYAGIENSKTVSDSIVVSTSSLTRFTTKVLSSSLVVVSTIIKAISRTLSDTFSVVSTLLNQGGKVLTDTFIMVDKAIIRFVTKVLTDVSILLSTLNQIMSRAFSDTFAVVSTLLNKGMKVLSDTFAVSDVMARVATLYRILTDTIITTSTMILNTYYVRALLDTLAALDSGINKLVGKLATDVFSVADTIKKYVNGFLFEGWNKINKVVSSFTKQPKSDDDWRKIDKFTPAKLKLQDGTYLLLQNNSKINIVVRRDSLFSNVAKTVSNWVLNTKTSTTWSK